MAEQIDGYRIVGPSTVKKMDAKLDEYVEGPDPELDMSEQPKPFNPTAEHNEVKNIALYGGVLRSSEDSE